MNWLIPKTSRRALAIACLLTILGLQLPGLAPSVVSAQSGKDHLAARGDAAFVAIQQARAALAANPNDAAAQQRLEAAIKEYQEVLAAGYTGRGPDYFPAEELAGPEASPGPPPNCTGFAAFNFSNMTQVVIPDAGAPVTSTITVSGAGAWLHDLDLTTFIVHTFNEDLDFTLRSPAGTIVTVSTDNGGGANNVFNGTLFDNDADIDGQVPFTTNTNSVTDHPYVDEVVATPLTPEESLSAFIGENPNGVWTLTIQDDFATDAGTLNRWGMRIWTLPSAPVNNPTQLVNATGVPIGIPDGSGGTGTAVTASLNVTGAGTYLCDVNLTTFITHQFNSDLQFTLRSPAGTIVTVSSNNGEPAGTPTVNVFNGSVFDDDADPDGQLPYTFNAGLVTDHPYVTNVVATPLAPEEPFGAFIGENPNGVWTFTIVDVFALDTGVLQNLRMSVTTCQCPTAGVCTLTCPTVAPVAATSTAGAVVSFPSPTPSGTCGPIVCSPASSTVFPVGTTIVTCQSGAAICTFPVVVFFPFNVCVINDSQRANERDTFRVITSGPLAGFFQYTVASTGEVFQGTANIDRPLPRLILNLNSPTLTLTATISYPGGKAVVELTHRPTNRRFVLRDRNTANNGPCP